MNDSERCLNMKPNFKRGAALGLVLLGSTALAGIGFHQAVADDPSLNETAAVQQNFTPIADFSNLVSRVSPAVVLVDVHLKLDETSDDQSDNGDNQQGGMPPGFPQLPGFPPGFPFGMGGGQQMQPQPEEAKGSGFIISSSGIVVTNNHVVKDAATITVTLADGKQYAATVLGTDPKTDLAVLKISAGHPLPYVQFGSSSGVVPGQWVVAVGNPFGLGSTVTAGIVSALGRDIGDGPYDRFIQFDAPINEGNSGGPLFDQRGEVIGINTAILSPSGGSVGIGFAIPSNMASRVVSELLSGGKVVRGYLGVAAQEITPPMAQALGLPGDDPASDGALVAAVSPDSPAYRAGLQPGDVITSVNGNAVTNPSDLAADIAAVTPGQDTTISFLRAGAQHQMTVAVATMPSNPDADFQPGSGNGPDQGSAPATSAFGLTLAPVPPDSRGQLGLPNDENGAVISQVTPNSVADQAGLQPGDVVVGVGGRKVDSPAGAIAAIKAKQADGAKAVALRIVRQGQSLFVGMALTDRSQG
jgi:serine protease Do